MNIIAGNVLPTGGWVERRMTVSPPDGLLRYGARETTRQLISRLSWVHRVDPLEVGAFVVAGLGKDILDAPPRSLPQLLKQQLNTLLNYAFPYDFYLFNNSPVPAGNPEVREFCQKAWAARGRRAGMIVRSTSGKAARQLDPEMSGAVVYHGNLTLYNKLTDAIVVFESLPEEANPVADENPDEQSAAFENDNLFL
jgi:hypothetical protein